MKEVVWIFGTSASGKETFIKSVIENVELRAKLGWADKVVQACQTSIENIGQFENDLVVNNRESILKEAQTLLNSGDIVLIKWQLVDTEANRLQRLKKVTSEAKQKIIKLEVSEDELVERLARKVWWHDYGQERRFIEDELMKVDSAITKLIDDFELTRISSSSSDSYQLKF